MKETIKASIFVLLLGISLQLTAQDWLQWRGNNRDGKVSGFVSPAAWPEKLISDWKVTVGKGDATPVISGERIFLNTWADNQEQILCLDANTGKEIWKYQYPATAVTGPAGTHPGPRSTPAISDNKIITYGASGILNCLDIKTGKLLWRKDNPSGEVPQFFTSMSPVISDNICIVHTGTKDKGEILALNINNGNEKWKWTGEGPAYASPSLMTIDGRKIIILFTEKSILALSAANGQSIWTIPTPLQQRYYNSASPYIDGTTIFITGQGFGTKAVSVEKSGKLYQTRELWSNNSLGTKWNTPVLTGGFLYGFSDQRRIFCMNATTGLTGWVDDVVNSDFATIVDCGDVLIGLPSTGNLIVFKPDPTGYKELAKYKVSETAVYTYPVVSGKYIFIKDSETLTRYSIPEGR